MTDPHDGLARKVFLAETAAVRAHLAEQSPTAMPRLFHLQRDHDVSGVSGTGRVANGVLWPDGTVSLRWIGERPSTVHWDRLADAEHVHGHGGATRIVWADEQQAVDRAAVRAEVLDEQGPGDRETLAEAAQMYRGLRTVIERTMAEPDRWDGDEDESFHLGRYVGWLASREQGRDEVLRLVSEVTTEANDVGGVDINDLVTRLQQAGHQLPDDEQP